MCASDSAINLNASHVFFELGVSEKSQRVNLFGFAGNVVSMATAQLYRSDPKAAMDNMETNEHGCVPIKIYLGAWNLHFIEVLHVMKYNSSFDFFSTT